jgi:hypothetical protein
MLCTSRDPGSEMAKTIQHEPKIRWCATGRDVLTRGSKDSEAYSNKHWKIVEN